LRDDTDLIDAEWALARLTCFARDSRRSGEWPFREVLNVIFYVLRGSIA
jgi:hypothetical protein